MEHIEERTLELFVLGDERAMKDEIRIRKHLDECAGCSGMFEEIKSYYAEVRSELEHFEVSSRAGTQEVLAKRRKDLERYFRTADPRILRYTEVKSPTIWRHFGDVAVRHPVVSSTFVLLLVAILAYSWIYITMDRANPSYYFYNTTANTLEVYNSSNKMLWSLPTYNATEVRLFENAFDANETLIADLNGEGRNDVLTVAAPRSDEYLRTLRIYDNRGSLTKTFAFQESNVSFRGEQYNAPFDADELLFEHLAGRSVNLFVYSCNGRSPSFLARLNGNLKVIGRYWHYGNFTTYKIPLYRNGVHELAITGIDDIGDASARNFQFLAILDPSKIVGDKESPETRGFGLGPSDAELYYIKFPTPDIETAEGITGVSRILRESNDSLLIVGTSTSAYDTRPGDWGFDYVFSMPDMKVEEVQFSSPTPETFLAFEKEGKVHGTFDSDYLKRLKDGVRYWDGKEWVKEATGVRGK